MTHVGEHRLEQYVLDELDAARREQVDAHVAGCARCRARLADERGLDELLLVSVQPAAPGAVERSLERLWERVDAEPGAPAAGPGEGDGHGARGEEAPSATAPASRVTRLGDWRRRWTAWWPAAAAAVLVVALLNEFGGAEDPAPPVARPADEDASRSDVSPTDVTSAGSTASPGAVAEGTPGEGAARGAGPGPWGDPVPAAVPEVPDVPRAVVQAVIPAVIPGGPVDHQRLSAVREELAAGLLALDSEHPEADAEQLSVLAAELLAPLRRQGWPVEAHVRALALEGGDAERQAALRLAHAEPALASVLAAALAERTELVLSLLESDPRPLQRSLSLARQVERLADPRVAADDPRSAWQPRALGLLTTLSDARGRAMRLRLLGRALEVARDDAGRSASLFRLLRGASLETAVDHLLVAGREAALREPCRALFVERVLDEPAAATPLLVKRLEDRRQVDPLLSYCAGLGLDELAAPLLARLEDDPDDDGVLATLIDLGGPSVATGLYHLWAAEGGRRRERLRDGLVLLLDGSEGLTRALGRRLAEDGSAPAVELSLDLPGDLGGELLLAALTARWDDRGGHGAALLTALAHHGGPAELPGLLDELARRPAQDPLLPLGWAVAARLDPDGASRAYAAAGGNPAELAAATRQAARRFAANSVPSRGLLSSLARDLAHRASP